MANKRAWWTLVISQEPNGPHDSTIELSDVDKEHITSCIEDDFTEGEIVADPAPQRILIQPSTLPDQSKLLPWIINESGDVEEQDVWKGDPVALVGFQARFDVQEVNLHLRDWLEDPQRAVGMYPVFVQATDPDADGSCYAYQVAIQEVRALPPVVTSRTR